MKRTMKCTKAWAFVLIAVTLMAFHGAKAQKLVVGNDVVQCSQAVKPTDIQQHIQYLADDRLLGRKPGTEGYQWAVDYVVDQLKQLNIAPGGELGTYLQTVGLRKCAIKKEGKLVLNFPNGEKKELVWGNDFTLYPGIEDKEVKVSGGLAFVGFGIDAPEIGYNDYEDLDVKGKIVVMVKGFPESTPSTIAAHSQNTLTLLETAKKHGAIGVLIASLASTPLSIQATTVFNATVDPNGKVYSRNYLEGVPLLGTLSARAFNALFKQEGVNLGKAYTSMLKGKPSSFLFTSQVEAVYESQVEGITSYNVIGLLQGSDPSLRNEYVVHSAHLDHIGVGTPIRGDSIYNGAHDNASGVASLLEIARIYSRLKEKPKRSILFVFVTAEEMGLLGSAYFAQHPTVPGQQIVAAVNTDMPTLIAPLLSVAPLGAEHSSLGKLVDKACRHLGIVVEKDPEPDQVRFIRSDQYSFVRAGIPALHIKYGNKSVSGDDLDVKVQAWREEHYHKPQDGPGGYFDFEAGTKYVQLCFLISYQAANESVRPQWNKGDFFGGRYGRGK